MRTNRNRIEFDGHLVRRYPLDPTDRANLRATAACHEAAREAGLPVPAVLAVHTDSSEPHLVMLRCAGTPIMTTALGPAAQSRLVDQLLDLLDVMRRVRQWPRGGPAWSRIWRVLADVAPTPQTLLAARQASSVRTSLIHGDLSGGNLMVSGDGDLFAVLDWDGAAMGDPALDWSALCANLPTMAAALRDRHPAADVLDDRAAVYLDTWPIQHELWLAGRHPWLSGDRPLAVPRV